MNVLASYCMCEQTILYNPMAYDPDGDSLSYELVPPLGAGANPLLISSYYVFPNVIGGEELL